MRVAGRVRARNLRSRMHAGGGKPFSPVLFSADFTALPVGSVGSLPGGLSFARASVATVQTSASQVSASIANDVARAGSDGVHSGLVIEETRTNLALNSRDITAATWSAASGGSTTTANAAAGPDGSVVADRSTVLSAGHSRFLAPAVTAAAVYASSLWLRDVAGGGHYQVQIWSNAAAGKHLFPNGIFNGTTWQRISGAITIATVINFMPADGADETANGGVAAQALDVISDMHQIELGSFATEYIDSGAGAGTRAGERLFYSSGSALIDQGRIGFYAKTQPKGSSSQYTANMRLWTIDANNYCEISSTTGAVIVVQGGVSYTTATAATWAGGDTVEWWVEAGGGSLATKVEYRKNAGSWVSLSTGSPPTQAAFSAAGALDLLCNGTAAQFSTWIQAVQFYKNNQRPAGA